MSQPDLDTQFFDCDADLEYALASMHIPGDLGPAWPENDPTPEEHRIFRIHLAEVLADLQPDVVTLNHIVPLFMSLSRLERAICLFNRAHLRRRVDSSLDILVVCGILEKPEASLPPTPSPSPKKSSTSARPISESKVVKNP